jgi:hypothetical protein
MGLATEFLDKEGQKKKEGDAVLARGYPRNHHNLVKHGFRPIWTCQEGYPEDEIPADIHVSAFLYQPCWRATVCLQLTRGTAAEWCLRYQ